ncbi:MAG TPA: type II toxin-antitoxin system RelE/ParE family toxin [Desulfobulbaceae bacterium]|nr:type II toxin-antitoxin system RelE/ParE family toxin [Desulfobulbaceae bacterium]
MKRVEFSPKADNDLEKIGDYIAEDNPRRAVSFIQEIRERCRKLDAFPEAAPRFPELGDNARILPHGNYVILYNVLDDKVLIERVLNGARDILSVIKDDG